IFMASRLVKTKNIPLALRAFAEVIKKHPHAGLIIMGSGPEERSLIESVQTLGIGQNVVFKSWVNDPFLQYKEADIFLTTSNDEGWGMTTVEAMAARMAIVMTDVGCAPTLLEDGKNALVVPVEDKDAV